MTRDIERLRKLRRLFGTDVAARKLGLVQRIGQVSSRDPASIRAAHDELLFICAYPDNAQVLRGAERVLVRIERFTREQTARAALADSGVAGTEIHYSFSFEMLQWLLRENHARVEIDWEDGSAGAALDELLAALVLTPERDGLLDTSISTQAWFGRAAGRGAAGLRWLLDAIERLDLSPIVRDRLMDAIAIPVRWQPSRDESRTFARFPKRIPFFQHEPLLRSVELSELLAEPLQPQRPQRPSTAHELIDLARAVLSVRQRETDPVTYANPREVYLFHLDRGIDVAVLGMLPERRLPIESYFGFVAARNRVPIAYGGGWVFLDRCEIGVNLFETFRGGESAYIFGQIMRAYRAQFGVREFRVDPYQFGADNEEAIQSGAFWFYHRLGFRPTEPEFQHLAEREATRVQRDSTYRSPPRVLRRLAGSQISLVVRKHGHTEKPPAVELTRLGLRISRWVADRFGADRERAAQFAIRRVARAAHVRGMERWPANERSAFERLAPILAILPDFGRWPLAERIDAAAALRAKGGPRERDYCLRMKRCERLWRAWSALLRG